jgi:hypothetical protein
MSFESAQRMYDAQEPCENCGGPANGRFCSVSCARDFKEYKNADQPVEELDELDGRR